jgi:hypothetical protein
MSLPRDYRKEDSLWFCLTHDKGYSWDWETLVTESHSAQNESDEQASQKAKRREFIRITALDILGFVCVLYFIWPTSHTKALWALIVWAGIQFGFSSWSVKNRAVAIAGLLILGLAYQAKIPATPRVESDTHGWLVSANDPTPANACSVRTNVPKGSLTIILGNSAVIWTDRFSRKGRPLTVLRVGTCDLLSFDTSAAGLRVNADIFTPQGLLAARITNNEFHLVSQQISYAEPRDTDRSTLAVHDPVGEEMLWVRVLNDDTIKVKGKFICPGSPPVIVSDETISYLDDTNSHGCQIGPFTNIKSLFVYR